MAIFLVLSRNKDDGYGEVFVGKGVFSMRNNSRVEALLSKYIFWYKFIRDSRGNEAVFSDEGPCIIWMMDWELMVKKTSPIGEIIALWLGM